MTTFVLAPIAIGAVALLVLMATPWGNERVRRILVSQANSRMKGELAIGTMRGNLFTGATLTDVRVSDSARQPVFTARRVKVRYGLLAALQRHVVIHSLVLDTPVVFLDKKPGAQWNFQTLLAPSAPRDSTRPSVPPELQDVTIHHGRFSYRRPWAPDTTLPAGRQLAAIAAALDVNARKRTEKVPGGYQRVLDYHDIDARIPNVAIAQKGQPTRVEIAQLSMIGEPYRPPVIDVRALTGTLLVDKDSLWWRGAHMALPGSKVTGDGTIGFHHSGLLLDLNGAPLALADLRWLDPKLAPDGGGTLHYRMQLLGDTMRVAVSDASLHYRAATLVGNADVQRIARVNRAAELLVRGADVTIAKLSTDIIHELAPGVPLRRSGVLDGHVKVSGSPADMRLDADLAFADAVAGPSRITAHGGVGFAHGMQAHGLSVQLRPLQLATLTGTGLHIPLAGVVNGNALVSGATSEGWTVSGDLSHQDRGEHSRVIGSGRYQAAGKRISADATLEPLSLATVGRFVPSAQLRGSVSGKVHAQGTTRDIAFTAALRSPRGGSFNGKGSIALAGANTRYDVAAVVDALDASAFTRRAPGTKLTGTVAVRGVGTAPASANAIFSADLVRSRYDTFSIERLVARGRTASGLLHLDTLSATERGAHVNASGTFGLVASRNGELHFTATVDSIGVLRPWLGTSDTTRVAVASARQQQVIAAARADSVKRAQALRIEQLALGLPTGVSMVVDTLRGIPRDSLAGSLDARGVLSGNVKRIGADAEVHGRDLVIRGNAARRLDATIVGADILHDDLRAAIIVDSAQLGSYGFQRIAANGTGSKNGVRGAIDVKQDSLVRYAASGMWSRPAKGEQVIALDTLRATFDTLVWRLQHPARVRLANGGVTVDSVDLRSSSNGRLFANGAVPATGAINLEVAAENVRVATVLRALQRDQAADGAIGVSGSLTGTRVAPVLHGRATLRDARYGETRAPDADIGFDYLAQRLGLVATATDSSGRRVMSGTASLPVNLALSGVTGSRKLPGALTADVVLDSLSLASLPLRSRTIDDVRGRVAGDARVRGSWNTPVYTGSLALRDGGLTQKDFGVHLANAVADLRLSGDSLLLDSLVARLRGPLRASGSVSLVDRSHPYVHLTATGTDLRVFDTPRGLVDANATILADGPLDALRVTGNGEMLGGYLALKQFRKDLLRVKAPGELGFFAVYDTTAEANDSVRVRTLRAQPRKVAIIADLSLVIDRGNYYRNRPDANTEFYTGDGEVVLAHVDQRSSDQWIVGFVRIGDGVTTFRTQAFVPARGALTFTPHTDAPGIVQQVGERIAWEPGRGLFALQLLTGGTSTAPSIGLESGTLFPIRGRELNGYLTMGRLSTSLLQQSGSSLSGSEAWSGQLSGETGALARRQQGATALGVVLHDIGTGATKEYGLDAFSVSPADVPTELVFGKTGGVRGAVIEGGKYLTVDRYVAAQLHFTSGIPGVRIAQKFGSVYRLDVGLEPRFRFRDPLELGITHPTQRTGVFAAFLTRMWGF